MSFSEPEFAPDTSGPTVKNPLGRLTGFFASRFSLRDAVLWRVMRLLAPRKTAIILSNLCLIISSTLFSMVLISVPALFNEILSPPKAETVLEAPADQSEKDTPKQISSPHGIKKSLREHFPFLQTASDRFRSSKQKILGWARTSTRHFVVIYFLCIMGIMIIQGLFEFVGRFGMSRVSIDAISDLLRKTYGNVLDQEMQFFDNTPTGQLMKTCYQEVFRMQEIIMLVASTRIVLPIRMLILFGALMVISLKMSILLLVLLPVIIIPTLLLTRRLKETFKRELEGEAGPLVVMSNAFQGIRAIKAFGAEELEKRYMEPTISDYVDMTEKRRRAEAIIRPVVDNLNMFVLLAVFVIAFLIFPDMLSLEPGTMLIFLLAVIAFYKPFRTIMTMNIKMQRSSLVAKRIFALLDRKPEIVDRPNPVDFPKHWDQLVFSNVGLTYTIQQGNTEKNRIALKNVNMRLNRGEMVALVGRNGAGKSSLVNLITRLYHATKGSIRIDDIPVKDIRLKSLREKICLITQHPVLFDRSVAENIAFGLENATPEQIEAAARAAGCHDFITALPEGYRTNVGEGGRLLSGGERQKVVLARAFIRQPEILILDEPTSGLDKESSKEFLERILSLRDRNILVIYITHLQSELPLFDRVLFLDPKKRILEMPAEQT
ncbi:ABC transporter ATP-binding protein [bacterium]|nr:ABC transporter ATP-binding protein [bacterium]